MLRNAFRRSVLVKRASTRLRGLDLDREDWFVDHYPEWRRKRIAAISDHYAPGFFHDKSLLEVGCGFGDIGTAFVDLGARVTCSDGRPGHVAEVKRRHPEVSAAVADLDKPWAFREPFDVLIHMGVMYHVADPEQAMRDALGAADHIVLETEVIDSADPYLIQPTIEAGYDQALNNRGARPTAALLERVISESGRTFERLTDNRCNDGIHVYDWPMMDTGTYVPGRRRLWFIEPA